MLPTDLEIVPLDEPPTMIIFTKFEVDVTIGRWITLLVYTLHDIMTFTFDLLTLDSGHAWQITDH